MNTKGDKNDCQASLCMHAGLNVRDVLLAQKQKDAKRAAVGETGMAATL